MTDIQKSVLVNRANLKNKEIEHAELLRKKNLSAKDKKKLKELTAILWNQ